jgi:folate-binding protein YgfZ
MIAPETLQQYRAVREAIGLIVRDDLGFLGARGEDRYSWLQGMVSNDVRRLESGQIRRLDACFLDATGHILSEVTLTDLRDDPPCVLLEMPASNIAKIAQHLDRFLISEEVELFRPDTAALALQGPKAVAMLREGTAFAQASQVWGAGTPYASDITGSGGFLILVAALERDALRQAIRAEGIPEIGPEAQEILRVEAGIPKYGVDMDETTLAPEANLTRTHISLTKGCYVGQEIIARIDSRGHTNRALTGLLCQDDAPPIPGAKLFAPEAEREVGWITSAVASSPAMEGKPIALGYVRHEHRTAGSRLRVGGAESSPFVSVVELPFYRGTVA